MLEKESAVLGIFPLAKIAGLLYKIDVGSSVQEVVLGTVGSGPHHLEALQAKEAAVNWS